MTNLRMAVIGLNHNHIYGQVRLLMDAGVRLAGFFAREDHLADAFRHTYPDTPRADVAERLLDDPSIDLIVSAAIPNERTDIAISAMRRGKDVLLDKPAATTLEQLKRLRTVQTETGRILSVYFGERLQSRCSIKAGQLIESGAIGKVLHITGMGPHRLRRKTRDPWFFRRTAYGGILVDLACHQCEQFLHFSGQTDAEVLSASVANKANPYDCELQDYGDIHLRSGITTGYLRVDWMTPEGLPVWGDGRMFIVGSEGTIELRKLIDVEGRAGKDHLFLVDREATRYIDCSEVPLTYGNALVSDILNRSETAMPQERCFKATELALRAQNMAEQLDATTFQDD